MTFLGWLSDPFKGLSDLQLGDVKGHFESPGFYYLENQQHALEPHECLAMMILMEIYEGLLMPPRKGGLIEGVLNVLSTMIP